MCKYDGTQSFLQDVRDGSFLDFHDILGLVRKLRHVKNLDFQVLFDTFCMNLFWLFYEVSEIPDPFQIGGDIFYKYAQNFIFGSKN
jgi:hypothetical protein